MRNFLPQALLVFTAAVLECSGSFLFLHLAVCSLVGRRDEFFFTGSAKGAWRVAKEGQEAPALIWRTGHSLGVLDMAPCSPRLPCFRVSWGCVEGEFAPYAAP